MKKKIKRLGLIVWILILGVVLVACGGGDEEETADTESGEDGNQAAIATATPVPAELSGQAVVYVVGPMSGLEAEKGQAQAAGARFAAQTLNISGGLMGREVIIRTVNDFGTPEGALEAAQTIAASGDEVLGVVLFEGSDPDLVAVREVYLSELDTLLVSPASANALPTDLNDPRFFRLSAPSLAQATEIVSELESQGLPSAVFVHSASEFDRILASELETAAANSGITLQETIELDPTSPNFVAAVERIRQATPAALVIASNPTETSQLLPELYKSFFGGVVFALDDAMPYAVVDEVGCQAEGMYRTSLLPEPTAVLDSTQLTQFSAQEGRVAEPYTIAGYAAIEFIVNAYNGSGTAEASAAAEQAQQTPIPTVLGELSFDANGNRSTPPMHFLQVQGRDFEQAFTRLVGNTQESTGGNAASQQTLLDLDFETSQDPIVFAGLNWNSVQFDNHIARIIIEAGYGYPTFDVAGSSVPLFQRQIQGGIDVTMELWLPNELYDQALADGTIVDLGQVFDEAEQGWFVPSYMVEGDTERGIDPVTPDLQSVVDLERYTTIFSDPLQPGLGQLMDGSPGWFAYRHNCMKLKSYRLDDNYAQITTGSDVALFSALSEAYEAGDPILLYLFEPTWPIAKYDLIRLEEPEYTDECWATDKACAYPSSPVRIVAHNSLPERAPEIVAFLEAFELDKANVSEALLFIQEEETTPFEAALRWLNDNTATWQQWVPSEVAERVTEFLAQQ